MKPRKHAELIKAWADGATIERLWSDYYGKVSSWLTDNEPDWSEDEEYRIKPEPQPEPVKVTMYIYSSKMEANLWIDENPPERFVYNNLYNYIGSIEVTK